jgi:uncharacterized protein
MPLHKQDVKWMVCFRASWALRVTALHSRSASDFENKKNSCKQEHQCIDRETVQQHIDFVVTLAAVKQEQETEKKNQATH